MNINFNVCFSGIAGVVTRMLGPRPGLHRQPAAPPPPYPGHPPPPYPRSQVSQLRHDAFERAFLVVVGRMLPGAGLVILSPIVITLALLPRHLFSENLSMNQNLVLGYCVSFKKIGSIVKRTCLILLKDLG